VELFDFSKTYVERLRAGDPVTQEHFLSYFGKLLTIKLCARRLPPDVVEDLRQETFARVLTVLGADGGIRQPDRLGAFVNSVCNHVLLEFYRSGVHESQNDESSAEPSSSVLDVEGFLATRQDCERVRRVLAALPLRDCQILHAIFFDERDKEALCREYGIDREYLRVLLHRAKDRFKSMYLKEKQPDSAGAATGEIR
jgi:RNA polymerase sigma-70 factor, ECF subfamily